MIGLLMIIGIALANAIVLLDIVQQYRDAGMTTRDALVTGGKVRLRPILMTALATVLGCTACWTAPRTEATAAARLPTLRRCRQPNADFGPRPNLAIPPTAHEQMKAPARVRARKTPSRAITSATSRSTSARTTVGERVPCQPCMLSI